MRSAWRRGVAWGPEAVFWSVPIVLFLPALYYSLTTPFALIDDIWQSRFEAFFSAEEPLARTDRYRPFWNFYNGVTWTVFGPVPWLHHLARWLTVAGAVFAFTAAFSAIPSAAPAGPGAASACIRLLPRALLVWLWVFFPNQPAARLGPQEVNTVFFMGLCTWMTARLLVRPDREGEAGKTRIGTGLTHGLFVLGFCGLVWSKETNLAVALWMLIFHCAPLLRGMDRARIASGLAVTAVFAHTVRAVSRLLDGQAYHIVPVTPTLLTDNAGWIAAALFQVETSPVITVGLAVLSALLPVFVAARAGLRMRFSSELLFVLFLLGQFASLYLALCTSPVQAPRYWYILVPVFTALLAFSAKFLLEFLAQPARAAARPASRLRRAQLPVACALAGFVVFFIGCNYSHALFQVAVQHRARHIDKALLAEITRLLDRDAHVRVLNFDKLDEPTQNIVGYYSDFLPRFHGREYDISDLHLRPGSFSGEGPRYWVTHTGDLPPSHELADDYRLLSYARDAAAFLQGGGPYWIQDWGVARRRWYVMSSEPSYGRDGLMQVGHDGVREPTGEVALDTRLDNSMTRYIREHSIAGSLFTNDLLAASFIRGHGSATQVLDGLPCLDGLPSAESPHDIHIAWFFSPFSPSPRERPPCVDLARLMDKRVAESAVTGPIIAGGRGDRSTEVVDLWNSPELELAAELRDGLVFKVDKNGVSPFQSKLRALTTSGEPVIDALFDVYLHDGELTYVRGDGCTEGSTRALFFLHVVPFSAKALPPSRRDYGFAAFGFDFERNGVMSDGKCMMTVPFPAYAVSSIAVGQYIPDRGELWRGEARWGEQRISRVGS